QRTAEKTPYLIAMSTGCRNESGMVRPSCFAVSRDSLAQTVSPFGERAHSVKALTCRNIKCLLVGAGECGVGGLARDLDGPKILTLGIKHLDARDRGDVGAIIAVDRYPVCATLRARGNVAKLREGALVLDRAVGLHVVGKHRRVEGIVDDQGLTIAGQRQPVGARHAAVEQDRLPRAGREVKRRSF